MERKLRETNGSLFITVPKQVCDLYNLRKNDTLTLNQFESVSLNYEKYNNLLKFIYCIGLNTAWSEKQNVVRPADEKPSFSPTKI